MDAMESLRTSVCAVVAALSALLPADTLSQGVNVLEYREITDTISMTPAQLPSRYSKLTDEDYQAVAAELGIEVAAMKAVVDVEAGRAHVGFYKPGLPIINFDIAMFRRFAGKRGIRTADYARSHAGAFAGLNPRKYGSTQAAQYARYNAACGIDSAAAIEGTFWGMFQIGGFNWKICGCSSLDDFVERMSFSEREQLELFATFLISTGYDKYLRAKNWSTFARRYNGPAYARRGYHTKLASAYKRHSKKR